jgi:hypothetical protein
VVQSLIAHLKARLSHAMRSVACSAIATAAALVAIVFFGAAAFVWVSHAYGVISACLMFGGVFALVAAIAATTIALLRRRPPPLSVKSSDFVHAFGDPKLLAVGLELARMFGGRRAARVGLIGAFIVGVLLSQSVRKK